MKQNKHKVQIGDTVYIWRSSGKKGVTAGIIAETIVDSDVWEGKETEASLPFSQTPLSDEAFAQVWLQIEKVASPDTMLTKDELKQDDACANLLIMRQTTGTNYLLHDQKEIQRLQELWVDKTS